MHLMVDCTNVGTMKNVYIVLNTFTCRTALAFRNVELFSEYTGEIAFSKMVLIYF